VFVELHLIQNFAPSNLNRDDTGAPKDCVFGGYRRARISSQCLKRAARAAFADDRLLPQARLAARTKRAVDELVRRLGEQGKAEAEARPVVEALLGGVGLGFAEDGKTQYLLFLGQDELAGIARLCVEHWAALSAAGGGATAAVAEEDAPTRGRGGRAAKQRGRAAVPREVTDALRAALDGGKAADLALFGRMLADLPDRNVDAACQVAHALSTHKVETEFDFYTAVDDLRPEETAGADMLGTIEFNSACFYRYASVDLAQLARNLGGDEELARRTLDAFVRAAIVAIPTGKQNSFAAHNLPSFVLAVARERGQWSLANAFVRPVRPTAEGDLVRNSVRALDDHWGKLTRMYGTAGIVATAAVALDGGDGLDHLAEARLDGVDDLLARLHQAVSFGDGAAGAA
jgi:CRISPR system Cascade subunit CasC